MGDLDTDSVSGDPRDRWDRLKSHAPPAHGVLRFRQGFTEDAVVRDEGFEMITGRNY